MPATAIRNVTERKGQAPPPLSSRSEAAFKLLDIKSAEADKDEAAEVEAQKVDFADLTAETVTVGDITIPIPSALADQMIRDYIDPNIPESIKAKKIKAAQLSKEVWRWVAVKWWVLDHQYEKVDGQYVIKRFMRKPEWRPSDEELSDYLAQLDYGPRLNAFYAAYRTATAF